MEKMKTTIPATDSIEELAKFWDTHDLSNFGDELEEVGSAVFLRRKETTVAIALSAKEVQELKRLAQAEGVKETKLVQTWVREKLRSSSLKRPPNTPLQTADRRAPVAAKPKRNSRDSRG